MHADNEIVKNNRGLISESNLLDLRTRREIYELIKNNEGLHFRSICRILNRMMGVVQYHIKILEKNGLIRSVKDGRYRCFFSNSLHLMKDHSESKLNQELIKLRETLITTLRRETSRKIIVYLADMGKTSHQKLSMITKVSPQAITFHIKKLFQNGIVSIKKEGRNKFYNLSEDARIIYNSIV